MAKKIINAKLDKNPSIAPLTKAESSNTKRRQNNAVAITMRTHSKATNGMLTTIPKMITLANHDKAVNNTSQLRHETRDYIQH